MKTFEQVPIPKPFADVVRRRMKPFVLLYWRRCGLMSPEDLAFSAYTQAVHDCAQLPGACGITGVPTHPPTREETTGPAIGGMPAHAD